MVRDLSAGLSSNPFSTPIRARQDRGLRETYVKGTLTARRGVHEWKAGFDLDFGTIHESFGYRVTDPDRFDPERFAPERAAERPRFAYIPFGGGPRICIGAAFAMAEATLILATIAQRYRLRLKPGFPVEPQGLITLRPRNGLRMLLERRQDLKNAA